MKKLLPFALLLAALNAMAQVTTLKPLKINNQSLVVAANWSSISAATYEKEKAKVSSGANTVVLEFPNAYTPKAKYELWNIDDTSQKILGTLSGTKVEFSITVPAYSTTTKALRFQVAEVDATTNVLLELTINKPALQLSTPVLGSACDTCIRRDYRIKYDFNENAIYTRNFYISKPNTKLLRRRFANLPWVGKAMSFSVTNINTFKFDISVTTAGVDLYPQSSTILDKAMAPPANVAVAAEEDLDEQLKQAIVDLGVASATMQLALSNSGDCVNVCPIINGWVSTANQFFNTYYGFSAAGETLDSFLTNKVKTVFSGLSDDEKKKLTDAIAAFAKVRMAGVAPLVYLVPQVQNYDQYEFILNIKPKTGIPASSIVDNQSIDVDILGGFRVDVSTGLIVTGLYDYKYSLRGDSTTIRNGKNTQDSVINRRHQVIRDANNKYDFGLASLIHFYPRLTKSINVGLNMGAAVTLFNGPKFRYLVGGSLLIGRYNRFAINAGWAMGFVDRLSSVHASSGAIYIPKASDLKMQKVFSYEPYIGVTYNIALKSRAPTAAKGATDPPKKDDSEKSDNSKSDN